MTEKPVRIAVQGHPGAKRNEVVRFEEGVWHIKIAAPATEGKANKELIEFLSELLDISKSRISIDKGATGQPETDCAGGDNQGKNGRRG